MKSRLDKTQNIVRHSKTYEVLSNMRLTRMLIANVKLNYQSLCPYNELEAEELAVTTILNGALGMVAAVALLFILNVQFCGVTYFTIVSPLFGGAVAFSEILLAAQNLKINRMNIELSEFMLGVSHRYQSTKSIVSAIESAAVSMSKEVNIVARFIIDLLTGSDSDQRVYEYVTDRDKNMYLKLFISQCYECFEVGDKDYGGRSVFCENIETYRLDMLRSRLATKEMNSKLYGMSLLIWLPTLAMGLIRRYGLGMSDAMPAFYSNYGVLIETLALLVSMWVYYELNRTKVPRVRTTYISSIYSEIQTALNLFSRVKGSRLVDALARVAGNVSVKVFYTKILVDVLLGIGSVLLVIPVNAIMHNTAIEPGAWLWLIVGVLPALFYPVDVYLLYKRYRGVRDIEVNAFQLILISESSSSSATLFELLLKMERVSNYYSSTLQRCLNTYAYNQERAITELRDAAVAEEDVALENIADMMLVVDKIGIKRAFDELRVAMELTAEEKRLNSSINADRRRSYLEIVTLIPAVIAIGIYFILPFAAESFSELNDVIKFLGALK